MHSKKAVSALVATVLLILITVAAVGIIWGAIMPMLNKAVEMSEACMNARLTIDTTSGYTCYSESKKQVSVMVSRGTGDFELAGMQIGLASGGQVKSYEIKPDSYTKLLSHFDGADGATAYTDPVAGAYTFVGTAQLDTAQKKFGTASLLLDGSSNYVTLPDSDDWNFGAGDFTIDTWVRFTSIAFATTFVSQMSVSGGTSDNSFIFRWLADNRLNFYYTTDGTHGSAVSLLVSWTPSVNTWYHVAVVRDGADLKFFVDGTQVGATQNISTDTIYDSSRALWVGATDSNIGATQFLDGWLEEFRVSKGIARWTANFAVPTSEYTDASNIRLPQQNEANTFMFSAENITEATIAPIVKVGNTEKTCGVTSKVQVLRCT